MALISIIIPAYNEQANIKELVERLYKVIININYHFEIIIINDGSSDDSLSVLSDLSETYKQLHFIDFSRNFGQQNALRAGYDYAKGDAVICMDADLQNPPELIIQMIQNWENGFDVVLCKRKGGKQHGSFFKEHTSKFFYKILNFMSETHIDQDVPDFRLIDRKLVNIIKELPEKDLFLRGIISWMGFKKTVVEYEHKKRLNGDSGYSSLKMFRLALSGLTGFSVKPLHFAIYLGIIMSGLSLIYILYAIIRYYTGNTISGWLSIIITITFLGGLQLFVLGIIGLYIGKFFIQTKNRPEYIVNKTTL